MINNSENYILGVVLLFFSNIIVNAEIYITPQENPSILVARYDCFPRLDNATQFDCMPQPDNPDTQYRTIPAPDKESSQELQILVPMVAPDNPETQDMTIPAQTIPLPQKPNTQDLVVPR